MGGLEMVVGRVGMMGKWSGFGWGGLINGDNVGVRMKREVDCEKVGVDGWMKWGDRRKQGNKDCYEGLK